MTKPKREKKPGREAERKPERKPETWRQRNLREKYGLTELQWMQMYDLQQGKCPICMKKILKPGEWKGRRAACVDHDHQTGRVRGLLHYRCNRYKVGANTAESAKRIYEYLSSTFDGRTL